MVERYRFKSQPKKQGRYSVSRKGMGGAPSKYKPSFCAAMIESGVQGYSVAAFAGSIRVGVSTLNQWAREKPEFAAAKQVAEACAAYFWETLHIQHASGAIRGNAASINFSLKNRVKDHWQERMVQEVTGRDQGPVRIEISQEELRGLSDDKLELLEEVLQLISTGGADRPVDDRDGEVPTSADDYEKTLH